MGILISRMVHEFLKAKGLVGKVLVIDGSFNEKTVKTCGCCGPPPSLDYHVDFADEDNMPEELQDPHKFTRVNDKMPVVVECLLFSAVQAANQQVIVMVDEDTQGKYRVYAKIM